MPVLYLKSKQSHLNLNLFPKFILAVFAFVSIQIRTNMYPCISFHVPSFFLFMLCLLKNAVMETASFRLSTSK